MAINYEFERNLRAAKASNNDRWTSAIDSMRNTFKVLVDAGIVTDLPVQQEVVLFEDIDVWDHIPKMTDMKHTTE